MIGQLPTLGLGWLRPRLVSSRPAARTERLVTLGAVAELMGLDWCMGGVQVSALLAVLPDLVGMNATTARAALGTTGRGGSTTTSGGVGVVPVGGVILPDRSLLAAMLDLPTPLAVSRAVQKLAADPGVSAIVLDVDSPGGVSAGLIEAAAVIRQARQSKPIVAVVNFTADGSAYWLAAQSSEVVMSPSAQAGGLGIVAAHADESQALAQAGIKTTLIFAGPRKVDGNPFEPLSDRARADIQARVNEVYSAMVNDIALGRHVGSAKVRADFGQGRAVSARQAMAAGMADKIDTLDNTIGRLMRKSSREASPATRASQQAQGADLDTRQRRRRMQLVDSAHAVDAQRVELLQAVVDRGRLPARALATLERALAYCGGDLNLRHPGLCFFETSYKPLTAGFYDLSHHEVWINAGLCFNGDARELVLTAAHEARHVWQATYHQADLYANDARAEADAAAYAARVVSIIR